jgi:Ser/Thr protein kinase RdoA (MazF antagonist)
MRCLADPNKLVGDHWAVGDDVEVTPLPGGMNSQTWAVESTGGRFVLKRVLPIHREAFVLGLDCARALTTHGVAAGAPVPTVDGAAYVETPQGPVALLEWVDGEPLTGDDATERALIGRTLAAAHVILASDDDRRSGRWHWVDPAAPHLDVEPWIRPVVAAVVREVDRLDSDSLTFGRLHGDPAPEAFRRRPDTGACGLIDWASSLRAPLLYDLASARMYLGGAGPSAPLVEAYLECGVLSAEEVAAGIDVFARFRWAVQADYFAWRTRTDNQVGLEEASGNCRGLADARRALGLG